MKHVKTLSTRTLKETMKKGGCGECQTSCQSACKTSVQLEIRLAKTNNFIKNYVYNRADVCRLCYRALLHKL